MTGPPDEYPPWVTDVFVVPILGYAVDAAVGAPDDRELYWSFFITAPVTPGINPTLLVVLIAPICVLAPNPPACVAFIIPATSKG